MPQISDPPARRLEPAQAFELSVLVDLEACWENRRKPAPQLARSTLQDLTARQKDYDTFRVRLAAYNKRYSPAHVTDLLLNTPIRLGLWCRAMRDLYQQVESDTRSRCPKHLLEKAYRWADQISARQGKAPVLRALPPTTVSDVIAALDAVAGSCDALAAAVTEPPPAAPMPSPHVEL
jgi:hypothetical protein